MYSTEEKAIIDQALTIIESKLKTLPHIMSDSRAAGDYAQIKFGNLEHEVFSILLLNNQHQLIACEELFRGTIDGAAVYPREVVKTVLQHNAAAVIFAHNHPSGSLVASQADIRITRRLEEALATVEVRVLDHIIVSPKGHISMMDKGLL